jgi:cytochrome P450
MTTVTSKSYDPLDPAVQADPYPFYAELRRDAPVQFVESLDAFVVSRHADVRKVLDDHETFSNQAMAALVERANHPDADDEVFVGSIIGKDGDEHARLRKIVNRGFTPRRVARLEADMRPIAGRYIERLAANGSGDLQAELSVPLPTVVIAMMLGVDPSRREEFRRWSEHMVLAVFEPDAGQHADDIVRNAEQMGDWLDEVIAQRDRHDADDLISVLLRAELDGGALTHEEVRVFVFTLLVAGSITTAYLIGNAVDTLSTTPHLLAHAYRDRSLVPALVAESLRHDAPTQMVFRTATREAEVAGVRIPARATVVALLGSANRDEAVFTDPDAFVAERDNHESLAFGHGAHYCLGAALARLEARVAIEELLARTSTIEPAGQVHRIGSLVFNGPTHLPLRVSPR